MKTFLAPLLWTLSGGEIVAAEKLIIPAEDLLALENGSTRVAIDRAKGAAITWLSWKDYPHNAVNIADPGRLIQQSYYSGRHLDRRVEGQHEAWSPWTWNPIQGGGVGSWARVPTFELENETLHSVTIPKLWDMPDEEASARMEQWTRFEPGMAQTLVVRCRLVADRGPDDRWGPATLSPQEVPACYFTRNFSSIFSYLGEGKWRSENQKPGPPWGHAEPPRLAMACFEEGGQGIAIFSPTAGERWNFGPHGHGASTNPAAGPCIHIAPVVRVLLGPQSTYEYRYWLVTGTREEIAASLDELWKKHSEEKASLTHSPSTDTPTVAP